MHLLMDWIFFQMENGEDNLIFQILCILWIMIKFFSHHSLFSFRYMPLLNIINGFKWVLLFLCPFPPFIFVFTYPHLLPILVNRIRYLLLARMLRLIRLLMHVRSYRAFVATFLTLIPSLMPYLGTIFCVLCIYCSLGVQVLWIWKFYLHLPPLLDFFTCNILLKLPPFIKQSGMVMFFLC